MTNKQWERWVAEVREDFPYLKEEVWNDTALISACALATNFEQLPEDLQYRILLTATHGVYGKGDFTLEQGSTAITNFIINCSMVYLLKSGQIKISSTTGKMALTKKGRRRVENDL